VPLDRGVDPVSAAPAARGTAIDAASAPAPTAAVQSLFTFTGLLQVAGGAPASVMTSVTSIVVDNDF